jgi:hypothetical protein
VRSLQEILATLAQGGTLGDLPFMPEMIRFCGKKFVVAKRAEKTCVAGEQRRMGNAVHLADLRCDGSAHDGCQAACLLFWREDWLKRLDDQPTNEGSCVSVTSGQAANPSGEPNLQTRTVGQDGSVTYICQATELQKVSSGELKLWNIGQYYREIRGGNVGWSEVKHLFRWVSAWFQWRMFRLLAPKRSARTSQERNISTGDVVEIRSKNEIWQSFTQACKHRGLEFSAEMLTFAGKRYRVLGNVERLIDEKTGRMKLLKNSCLILDSVICRGHCTLCPRAAFHFWRKEWLTRV